MRVFLKVFAVCLALAAGSASAQAEEKPTLNGVALIIGQSKYENISALPNPANDARDMLTLLTDLGFDARSVTDRDSKKLKRDLERFAEDAEGADVAFLYYSGHGLESDGENWLVPVDADLSSLENVNEDLVGVSALIDEIKAKVPVTIVLLDACRTNPFPPGALVKRKPGDVGKPVAEGGLTPVRGAVALNADNPATENLGTVVGFAAEPGRPALDGDPGANSPYASALLRHLGAIDGDEFGAVMRMVTEEVYLDTGTKQRPWVNESLRRFLYFGVPAEQPEGDEGIITGERRKLLLTISNLPDVKRAEIQTVAAKSDVPLDSMFGVLRALGADTPTDPEELEKVLDVQAKRLKEMMNQKNALDPNDPEIARLSASADTAIRQGALEAAKTFLDRAVARVEETRSSVDQAEELIEQKRIADAAVYAKRGAANALAFDYLAAAADYEKAYELVKRWDDKLALEYKHNQSSALGIAGDTAGDRQLLDRAVASFESLLKEAQAVHSRLDVAIIRNDMGTVYQTIGESEATTEHLELARGHYLAALEVFEDENDTVNWALAQVNLGTTLFEMGERERDPAKLQAAIGAFRDALAKQDRAKVPLDWATTQNNIGIASFTLFERTGSVESLEQAEAAYRLALDEYKRDANPVQWALVQNNLGNTLGGLGGSRNDVSFHQKAAEAFRAALEVRTRKTFPMQFGGSTINLGNALFNIGKMEAGTANLEAAVAAYKDAIAVVKRKIAPMDWASAQHNMAAVLQTIGQRTQDPKNLQESLNASRAAMREFTRVRLPLDWAMAQNTVGNTYLLMSAFQREADPLYRAATAFRSSLEVYNKQDTPQPWAMVQGGLGSALQSLSMYEAPLDNLKGSIAARRAALEILTFESTPTDWATSQNGLAGSLISLNNFEPTPEYLTEAEKALAQAQRVFTRDALPAQWAGTVNSLGDVHWARATRGGGKAEYEKSIARFEEAKQVYADAGFFMFVPLLDNKITIIRDSIAKLQ